MLDSVACCSSLYAAVRGTAYTAYSIAGSAQNAKALFQQGRSAGAQQAGRQAHQQTSNAFPQTNDVSVSQTVAAPLPATPQPVTPIHGRTLTFVSADGKAVMSSTTQPGSEIKSGDLVCHGLGHLDSKNHTHVALDGVALQSWRHLC